MNGGGKHLGHVLGQRPKFDQLVQAQLVLRKLADRHQRPVDGHRSDRGIEARAVEHARIDHWLGLVHAPADRGDDLVDDAQQVRFVLERHVDAFELAAPLDEAVLVPIDQDVVDRRILEQRFKRSEADHLVHDVVHQRIEFGDVDRQALLARLFRDEFVHLAAHLVARQPFERNEVDFLDERPVEPHPGVHHPVGCARLVFVRLGRGWLGLSGIGDDDRNALGRQRCRVAGKCRTIAQRRKATAHARLRRMFRPNSGLRAVASATSGTMMRLRSRITLAFGSISCSGTPRSTASRTSL